MHLHRHNHTTHTGRSDSSKHTGGWLLAILLVAQLMVILDITAVNIAMPNIAKDLGISGTSISWTITSYSLIFGSLLLLGGRAADLLGRRRLFLTGLGVFTISSLLSAMAGSGRRAIRRPGRSRPGGIDALARSPLDHHHGVSRPAARQGAGGVGRDRRCRRRDRRSARRRPHRAGRLADDLLRQPAGRDRARDRSDQNRSRRHQAATVEGPRPSRRRRGHREPWDDRLRDHPGRPSWLDLGADAHHGKRRAGGSRTVRRLRASYRAATAQDRATPRPRRRRRDDPDAARSAGSSSGCSCSARSTCSSSSARGLSQPGCPSSRWLSRREPGRTPAGT